MPDITTSPVTMSCDDDSVVSGTIPTTRRSREESSRFTMVTVAIVRTSESGSEISKSGLKIRTLGPSSMNIVVKSPPTPGPFVSTRGASLERTTSMVVTPSEDERPSLSVARNRTVRLPTMGSEALLMYTLPSRSEEYTPTFASPETRS